MVIRSNKNAFRYQLVFPAVLCCVAVVFFAVCLNLWIALVLFGISGMILLDNWAIISRKFVLDEFGCTIQLGKRQWKYAWEELQIKRIESSYLSLSNYHPCGGFFFSVKKVRKSTISDPQMYHRFLRPFYHITSCAFGYFIDPKKTVKEWARGVYEVDKAAFSEAMERWNVDIEKS